MDDAPSLGRKTPWLNPQLGGWDEDLPDWILYGDKVVGISASAIQGSVSALRNMHLICGKADFTKSGNRFKRLLRAIKLKTVPKEKTPPPSELVQELAELSKEPTGGEMSEQSIVAIVAMFSFLLRGSEMANLRRCDVRFGKDKTAPFVTIFIARPKTDQTGKGVYRSLVASGQQVCVATELLRWEEENRWKPDSKARVFRNNIPLTVSRTLERISALKGLPTKFYSIHSMRAGGATHLYLSKLPLDIIQRFGRWISPCFLVYLRYDNIALRHLGRVYNTGNGVLNRQLSNVRADGLPNTNKSPTTVSREKGSYEREHMVDHCSSDEKYAVGGNIKSGGTYQHLVRSLAYTTWRNRCLWKRSNLNGVTLNR